MKDCDYLNNLKVTKKVTRLLNICALLQKFRKEMQSVLGEFVSKTECSTQQYKICDIPHPIWTIFGTAIST